MILSESIREQIDLFLDKYSKLLTVLLVAIVGAVVFTIIKLLIKAYVKKQNNNISIKAAKFISTFIGYTIIITVLLVILDIIGLKIVIILIVLGLILLIIGLASKKEIADIIAGFSIALTNPFNIDEVIEINGFKGKVIEMNLKSTKLLGYVGELKIINNSCINEVINYSRFPHVLIVDVNISKNEDVDKVISILDEHLFNIKDSFNQVVEGPNVIGVVDFDDKKIVIRTTTKIVAEKQYEVERSLKRYINELFVKNNIKLPKEGE